MRYTRQLTPYLKYNHMFCDPQKSSISYVVWLILVHKLLFWACFMIFMSKCLHSSDERFVLVLCAILSWWLSEQWCPWRFHIMGICQKELYAPSLQFSCGAQVVLSICHTDENWNVISFLRQNSLLQSWSNVIDMQVLSMWSVHEIDKVFPDVW